MLVRNEIVEKVKTRIDELVPFGDSSIVLPVNALLRPIHALIESELDNATTELLQRAPLYLLTAYEHNLYSLAIGEDKVAYLNMPDDFLRLALLWLRGWHRPVQAALSRENPIYKLQHNPYTRGGNAKPVAVLADYNPLLAAQWSSYACQREAKGFAQANNGYEVALILTINEHSFSPLNAFGSYSELSIERFVWLGEQGRLERAAAFISYLSKLTGIDIYKVLDKDTPDRRENNEACSILDGIAYIQVASSNISLGEVKASGWYNIGSTTTVSAGTSNIGIFEGWYENDVLVSAAQEYSFVVIGNRNLVAKFKLVQYEVVLKSENTEQGTVSGGGTVDAGQSVNISATPKEGWAFDAWYYNGHTKREDIPQNGTFTPTEDCKLEAKFKKKTAEITVNVNNDTLGKASGGGTYEIGTSGTVFAEPAGCYKFVEWRESGAKVSDNPEYSFEVTADRTLTAIFEVVYVTVTVTSDTAKGIATVNGLNSVTAERCTYVSLQATPAQGWSFAYWRIDGVVQPQLGATASYKAEGDVTLEAVFYQPAVYVYADGKDEMPIYDNHKYYGRAYISSPILCSITASCWLKVGGVYERYTVTIEAGSTSSEWKLVCERVADPDLNDWGCESVANDRCDGKDIIAYPGTAYG